MCKVLNVMLASMLSIVCLNQTMTKVNATTIKDDINISAKQAIVLDIDTGEVVFSYNADIKSQMASTTKLMTALILAENRDKEDLISFTELAKTQPSSSIFMDKAPFLEVGDKFVANDTMLGLLLSSGNDMACMIAENISGDINTFSKLMDKRALELGMLDTDYYTPSGLDDPEDLKGENHYSTPYDLALLGIEVSKNEWVRSAIGTANANISTVNGEFIPLENSNKNLGKDGCIGGKTGFTDKAGRCLVTLYERDGRELVGVVLGGEYPNYFDDMNKIIDYAYTYPKTNIINSGDILAEEKVPFKPFKFFGEEKEYNMQLYIKEDVSQYVNDFNEKYTEINTKMKDFSAWDLDELTVVGEIEVKVKNDVKLYNLYSNITTEMLLKDNIFDYLLVILAFILVVMFFVLWKIKKRKSIKKYSNDTKS